MSSSKPTSPIKADSTETAQSSNPPKHSSTPVVGNRQQTRKTGLLTSMAAPTATTATTTSSDPSSSGLDTQTESESCDNSGEDFQSSDASSAKISLGRSKKTRTDDSNDKNSKDSKISNGNNKESNDSNNNKPVRSAPVSMSSASSVGPVATVSSSTRALSGSPTKPKSSLAPGAPSNVRSVGSKQTGSDTQQSQPAAGSNVAPEKSSGTVASNNTSKDPKGDLKTPSQQTSPSLTQTPVSVVVTPSRSSVSSPSTATLDSTTQTLKKEIKKPAHENPSTNTMTVETETVSAVPALAVAGVPESSIKVKKSIDNVHGKSSHRTRKKKASTRLGSHVPTKAEVFASKIASAVDEAQSSDSDETFIYESNPADQQQRPVNASSVAIGTTKEEIQKSLNPNTQQQLLNPNNAVSYGNGTTLGKDSQNSISGSSSTHTNNLSISSANSANLLNDSYQALTANSRRNTSIKNHPNQLINLQPQQPLVHSASSVTPAVASPGQLSQHQVSSLLWHTQNGVLQHQLGRQNSTHFNGAGNQAPNSEDYLHSGNKVSPPLSLGYPVTSANSNDSNALTATTAAANGADSASSYNLPPNSSEHINDVNDNTLHLPSLASVNGGNSNNNTINSIGPNNTINSASSSNAGTINSTGTIHHLHPQQSMPQLTSYANANGTSSSALMSNYHTAIQLAHLQQGLAGQNVGDLVNDDYKTLKKKPSCLRAMSSSSSTRPESPGRRNFSSRSNMGPSAGCSSITTTNSVRGGPNNGTANANHLNHYNSNIRHQSSIGLLSNHHKNQYEASIHSERGATGNNCSNTISGPTTSLESTNPNTNAANGNNNSNGNTNNNNNNNTNSANNNTGASLYKQYGSGIYRSHGNRWHNRLDDPEYIDEFYDEYDNDSDNEDDEGYMDYSETTPLRKSNHGMNSAMYSQMGLSGGMNGVHHNNHGHYGSVHNHGDSNGSFANNYGNDGLNGGYNRRVRGSYSNNGFRAYSPHNYQRRNRDSSNYEKLRRVIWFCFGLGMILMLGFIMGFVLATTKPLHSVTLSGVFDVLVSDEELVFDMAVEAVNPGYLNVEVYSLDLDVFARSPYVKGDPGNSKTEDTMLLSSISTPSSFSEPSNYAMLLGNIRHFEVPLIFEGSIFEHRVQRSLGQLKLVNPGLNSTLPDDEDDDGDGGDGDNGDHNTDDENKDPNTRIPDNGNGDFDGDDDFGNQAAATTMESRSLVKPLPFVKKQVSSLDSNKHFDNGQKRWAIVNTHPFDLILRGVIKYQLALDRTPRVASITRVTAVDPNKSSSNIEFGRGRVGGGDYSN